MNPCPGIQKDKLYVGGEQDKLNGHPWMKARFSKMGGKYNTWYKTKVDNKMKILNCGITGGHRKVMQRLFGSMIKVLQDPALSATSSAWLGQSCCVVVAFFFLLFF
ncbi:unnamed protein product [Polarella glacialis]|uniref:Uncharacterized protein n=1 Tax=Polarella glacialis TaxID=89957 RepID=A0A813FWZ5_POLGL|nr:unnamed protein product [Polarella glacialis]